MNFRQIRITRTKRAYMILKGSIIQNNITILNMHTSNNRASEYMRQKLIELKEEMNISTIIVGEFNTPFSVVDRLSWQKITKGLSI